MAQSRNRFRWRTLGALTALVFLVLGFRTLNPTLDYPKNSAGSKVSILINNGATGADIAQLLEQKGVVLKATRFISLITADSRALSISPGAHSISTHVTSEVALLQLLDPTLNTGLFEVSEGSTTSDVFGSLGKSSNIKGSPWKAKRAPVLANPRNSLEGQLFPAIYSFAPETPVEEALTKMTGKFAEVSNSLGLDSGFENYTPYQVLIIASMAQIEGDETDFAKVARVIYNRLKIGMALQLNSTVQYANGSRGEIQLSTAATKIHSPYNTYLNIGLTPTPISNPSKLAITAALHPASGNWLYFITVKPRDTRFTNKFKEFNNWVTEYNNNLAAGLFH